MELLENASRRLPVVGTCTCPCVKAEQRGGFVHRNAALTHARHSLVGGLSAKLLPACGPRSSPAAAASSPSPRPRALGSSAAMACDRSAVVRCSRATDLLLRRSARRCAAPPFPVGHRRSIRGGAKPPVPS